LRLVVEDLKFDPDTHYKLKINRLKYNHKLHGEWSNFVSNQKK